MECIYTRVWNLDAVNVKPMISYSGKLETGLFEITLKACKLKTFPKYKVKC